MSRRLAPSASPPGLLSGLLGIGGGIVIVPGLIWAAGLDRHTASGTSLLAILPIAVVAAITYAVAPGGAFDPEASAIFVIGSVAGAVLGARVNARVSERALRLAMAVLSAHLRPAAGDPARLRDRPRRTCRSTRCTSRCCCTSASRAASSPACSASAAARSPSPCFAAIGVNQVLAQGIAITATIPTVIVGALQHRRQGTLAPREGLMAGLVGMAFAIPGAFLAFALPVEVLRTGFGVFLLFGSYRMFRALRRLLAVEPAP